MSAFIKNAAEILWEQPGAYHHNGAYSKILVTPAHAATKHFDYRISS